MESVNNFFNLISNFFYTSDQKLNVENELINILLVFFMGSVFGLVVLSKFLTYINDKFPNQLNHLIIGFVIGTLSIVWPWNQIKNNIEPFELSNSLNSIAIVLILIGILITVIVNSYVDKENLRVNR